MIRTKLGGALAAMLASCLLFVPTAVAQDHAPAEDLVAYPTETQVTNAYLVALTVLFEATNQPLLGQELVARVVENRAAISGTPYYETVVFSPGQFCGWTDERKQAFGACQVLGTGERCFEALALDRLCRYQDPISCQAAWLDLLSMAWAVTIAKAPQPRGWEGVTHFDNPDFWPTGEPPWAASKTLVGCVADHCFWRPRE